MTDTSGYIKLGDLVLDLPSRIPKEIRLGDPFLLQYLARDRSQENRLFDALEAILSDEYGGMYATIVGKYPPRTIAIGIEVLPAERQMKRSKRKKTWSENMEIILRNVKVLYHGQEKGLLSVSPEDAKLDMPAIYQAVPSPPEPSWTSDHPLFDKHKKKKTPEGIRTAMYNWQLRSLGRMLQIEQGMNRSVDPELYPILVDETGEQCYLHIRSWDLHRHSVEVMRDLPKSGILGEAMGSGKTLVALAIIILTLDRPLVLPWDAPPTTAGRPTTSWKPDAGVHALEQHGNVAGQSKFRRLTMHVGRGSLIVVPSILVNHWADEIRKHIEVVDTLKIYCVHTKEEVPKLKDLIGCDIIVLSRDVLEQDYKHLFASVYWRRVMFDEGSFAGVEAGLARIRELRAECRWLISGMLTDNLCQGIGGIDNAPRPNWSSLDDDRAQEDDDDTDNESDGSEVAKIEDDDEQLACSPWDYDDIKRLGNMLGIALDLDQPGLEGLRDSLLGMFDCGTGEQKFGAVYRVREIMHSMIIKHQANVIDREWNHVDLDVQPTVVPMDPIQLHTYNILIAGIMLNRIYFEDERTPGHLLNDWIARERILENLRLSTLWYCAPDMGLRQLRTNAFDRQQYSRKAADIKTCEAIMNYLGDAMSHREWSMYSELATPSALFQLEPTPCKVQRAFCDIERGEKTLLIEAMTLGELQWLNRMGTDVPDLILRAKTVLPGKKKAAAAWLQRSLDQGLLDPPTSETSMRATTAKALRGGLSTLDIGHEREQKKQRARLVAKARAEKKAQAKRARDKLKGVKPVKEAYVAPPIDILGQPRPTGTKTNVNLRSGKLSKMVELLQSSEADDRFVVFGSEPEIGTVAEVLRVVDYSFAVVITSQALKERCDDLEAFKTDPSIKILLLEPSCGATGLDLTCANKMIFLSDCWGRHEINQGIKRIHRNGQLRPTTVYILKAKDTFEDTLDGQYSEELLRNWQERALKQPRFCTHSAKPDYTFSLSLLPPVNGREKPAEAVRKGKRKSETTNGDEKDTAERGATSLEESIQQVEPVKPKAMKGKKKKRMQ